MLLCLHGPNLIKILSLRIDKLQRATMLQKTCTNGSTQSSATFREEREHQWLTTYSNRQLCKRTSIFQTLLLLQRDKHSKLRFETLVSALYKYTRTNLIQRDKLGSFTSTLGSKSIQLMLWRSNARSSSNRLRLFSERTLKYSKCVMKGSSSRCKSSTNWQI